MNYTGVIKFHHTLAFLAPTPPNRLLVFTRYSEDAELWGSAYGRSHMLRCVRCGAVDDLTLRGDVLVCRNGGLCGLFEMVTSRTSRGISETLIGGMPGG